MGKIKSIQVLRAIAAILVVYTHSIDLQRQFSISKQQSFYYLGNFGCIGVDLFFVISGFIIAYVARSEQGVTKGFDFLLKRFLRINPIYYVASLLFLAVFLFDKFFSNQLSNYPFSYIVSCFLDTILIFPVTGDMDYFKPILIVGWTLSFEWLFYILYFILIASKIRLRLLLQIGVIILLIVTGYIVNINSLQFQFVTNSILLEFLLGSILCWFYFNVTVPIFVSFSLLGIGVVCYVLLIIFGYGFIWPYISVLGGSLSMERFILWGIPSSLIVAGCLFLEKNFLLVKLWANKYLQFAGDASFSIYLIHPTIFALLSLWYKENRFYLNPDLSIFIQLTIAILAAFVFYLFVEKPITRYTKKYSVRDNSSALASQTAT